jgi:SAM-dependent methyltransferase
MMGVRLIELHRVLKPTGSLYLHCDPTASHYLKLMLDSIFDPARFGAEIIWKRSTAHSDAKQGRRDYGRIHDSLLYYRKSESYDWNTQFTEYDEEYTAGMYKHVEQETGRRYGLFDLTGPGGAAKGNPSYEFMGVTRYWRFTKEKMNALLKEGRIEQRAAGTVPRQKRYLDEMPGVPLQDMWTDLNPIGAQAQERLGYPTQKPLALLERIISVSSNADGVVLDPFCGCGTAVHAAQKLNRHWIGIDITHLAIGLIERRLKDAFPGIEFDVHGTPKDFAGAENLAQRDKFQFQWWAVTLINAVPYGGKKKGADSGIDGYFYCKPDGKKTEAGIVSVKGGETVHRNAVGELRGVMERDKAPLGVLITLRDPTGPMKSEAASAGFLETPFGKFQRLQVVTVGDLLEGKLPKLPPQEVGGGYKLAPKETAGKQEKLI